MKLHTKILTGLAVVLASFALYGFGGGGGRVAQDTFRNLGFNGYSSTELSFPKFDRRKGTLVGVQFGMEIDAQWAETVTNTGPNPDSVALSWDSNATGYYPPSQADVGTNGFSAFALELELPGQGLLLQRRTTFRDVEFAVLQPNQPTAFFQQKDDQLGYGSVIDSDATLDALTGPGDFTLPVNTEGYLATAGNPQGTIDANCFAQAVVSVRYLYIPR
jgi:hypothetical protein